MHPDSLNIDQEYDVLKKKIDLGANQSNYSIFFDVDCYFEFIDGAIKSGISIPIIPWNSSSY